MQILRDILGDVPGLEVAWCSLVLFLAMIARSAFGFGHAAFAMPLLLLFVDVRAASPLLGTLSLAISALALIGGWRTLRIGSTFRLIAGALIGIPLGVMLLTQLSTVVMSAALGVVLLLLSVRALRGIGLPQLNDDRLGFAFGIVGGILGGAFNLTGIPAAIYGTMRGWSPAEFRSTLTGYLLITSLGAVIGYYSVGLLDADFARRFVLCLVPAILGSVIGDSLNGKMSPRMFERLAWGIILWTSLLLLWRTLFSR